MAVRNQLAKGKRKLNDRPLFSGLHKPVPPPGHPLTEAKPAEKARPAGRKAKHKRPTGDFGNLAEAED
jgi:hypothetical protein